MFVSLYCQKPPAAAASSAITPTPAAADVEMEEDSEDDDVTKPEASDEHEPTPAKQMKTESESETVTSCSRLEGSAVRDEGESVDEQAAESARVPVVEPSENSADDVSARSSCEQKMKGPALPPPQFVREDSTEDGGQHQEESKPRKKPRQVCEVAERDWLCYYYYFDFLSF